MRLLGSKRLLKLNKRLKKRLNKRNTNTKVSGETEAQFASLLGFLQGMTTQFAGVPNHGYMYWRSIEGAWYVQDVWQLRPGFTASYPVTGAFFSSPELLTA